MRADLRPLCLELSRNGITAAEMYQRCSGQAGAPSLRTCRQALVTLTEEGTLHAHGGNVKVYFLRENLPQRLRDWRIRLQARVTEVLASVGTWADFAQLRRALAEVSGGYGGDPTLLSDVLQDLPDVERQTVRLRRDEITQYRLPPPTQRPALDPALIHRASEAASTLLHPDGPRRFSGVAFRNALGVAREVAEQLLAHLVGGGLIRAIEGCLIATFEAAPRRAGGPRPPHPRRRVARTLPRSLRARPLRPQLTPPVAEEVPDGVQNLRAEPPQSTHPTRLG